LCPASPNPFDGVGHLMRIGGRGNRRGVGPNRPGTKKKGNGGNRSNRSQKHWGGGGKFWAKTSAPSPKGKRLLYRSSERAGWHHCRESMRSTVAAIRVNQGGSR